MSEVQLQFMDYGLRPPPFIDLLFHAEIENPAAKPVWVLFPLYIDPSSAFAELLASSVEIVELPGKGLLRIARFLGDGSFQAIRLPANARIRIHQLPITYIGEPPKTEITVSIIVAEKLNIGDQPAEDWFSLDLTSSKEADVTEEPGAVIASQDTPGAKPLPVTPSGAHSLHLRIPLRKR